MKKVLAFILAAVMLFALTGCVGTTTTSVQNATSDEVAQSIKASDYTKDFKGLQQYLLDKGYIYGKDGNGDSLTSEVYYDILGANDGIRYYFTDRRTFVEFYDFSGEQNDTAKTVLEKIKTDGKFTPVDGLDDVTAVLSKSGKYVALYNSNSSYDYSKITDELKNW